MAAPQVLSDEQLFQLTGNWEAAAALRDAQYNAVNEYNASQVAPTTGGLLSGNILAGASWNSANTALQDALTEAAKTLIHHFMLFSDERITLEADEIAQTETYDEESLHMRQLLKTKLIDMDLSVRALNCLKAAEVDTLGDLVSFNKNDLMKFRNFGKKSLTELEELVIVKGLNFGMDLSKYKLDKD